MFCCDQQNRSSEYSWTIAACRKMASLPYSHNQNMMPESHQIDQATHFQLISLKLHAINQPKWIICHLFFVDHASFRNEKTGSVYVNELCDVLREDRFDHHLADMLVRLNDKMGNLAAIKLGKVMQKLGPYSGILEKQEPRTYRTGRDLTGRLCNLPLFNVVTKIGHLIFEKYYIG